MILIGNGPIPFAHPGSPDPGAGSAGVSSRSAKLQNGTAPETTIPAATPKRAGQPQKATITGNNGIRAVLSTSRSDTVVTNPQDIYRALGNAGENTATPDPSEIPKHLEYRSAPAAPLSSYATIPTEVTAEIQRLRQEIVDLKAELAAKDEMTSAKADADLEEANTACETACSSPADDETGHDKAAMPATFADPREERSIPPTAPA